MNLILLNVLPIPVLDVVIVLLLLSGAVYGSKIGFIKSVASFFGTLIALIGAYLLKNPISVLLYTYLPFFKFNGIFKGITSMNILVYEAISFILVLSVLTTLLKLAIKLTGLLENLLDATIVLGIPSKIFGAIFGACEMYLFLFIVVFLFNQIPQTNFLVKESTISLNMLEKTPVLSDKLSNAYNAYNEIYDIAQDYYKTNDEKVADSLAFEILLKNKIITKENAEKLVDNGKIDNELCKQVIKNYKE